MDEFDLVIIGAGPAGMSAAVTAADRGARVLLLDEQPRAGGQIFRDSGRNGGIRAYLGKDYAAGARLVRGLDAPSISTEFGVTVWRIETGPRVVWSRDGTSRQSSASHVLLAGGAQERPVPFPGWTLPGVMPAGAAQILMKSSGLLPRDAVLAGSGPLLYLIAAQLIDAGAPPQALVETQTLATLLGAAKHLPNALRAAPTLFKGVALLRKIRAAGLVRHVGASGFRARATEDGSIEFRFESRGHEHHLTAPIVLTHQGVVPATHLSRAAGIAHVWNDRQQALRPRVDAWGRTDVQGLHVAGDGAGIGGVEAAQASGRLAALDILHLSGRLDARERDIASRKDRTVLGRAMAIRPFLDAAYAPLPELLTPPDETIVCRCEEVSAADIRRSVAEGANGPRQVKTAVRAGMGACQGRMCESTVRAILESCGAQTPVPRARSPVKPVKLGEIAALAPHQEKST